MDRNRVLIAVAVAGFVVAGVVTYLSARDDRYTYDDIPIDQTAWLLCVKCKHAAEVPLRDYYRELERRTLDLHAMVEPALVCEKCNEESVWRGYRCGKCEHLFMSSGERGSFVDKCPECGFSQIGEDRTAGRKSK